MNYLLYDSDLLGDDLLALSMIAKNPDMRLLGVTAFGRRVCAHERCATAAKFLDELEIGGISFIPGASTPLVQPPRPGCRFCDNVLDSLAASWKEGSSNRIDTSLPAAEWICKQIHEHPHEVDLLCTGPLTNIALALSLDPSIAPLVKSITMMGGTWRECGNSSAVAEANIFNDPEAAAIVFAHFPHIVVVPLDVTLKVLVKASQIASLPDSSVKGIILACCNSHLQRGEEAVMPLHDVLAYMVMLDPTLVTLKQCTIQVETKSSISRAMLVMNWSRGTQQVALEVDHIKAETIFLDFLRSLT